MARLAAASSRLNSLSSIHYSKVATYCVVNTLSTGDPDSQELALAQSHTNGHAVGEQGTFSWYAHQSSDCTRNSDLLTCMVRLQADEPWGRNVYRVRVSRVAFSGVSARFRPRSGEPVIHDSSYHAVCVARHRLTCKFLSVLLHQQLCLVRARPARYQLLTSLLLS